jgi:beta-phosphoglucomutase-like phosphatase (HAD superfamily)
MDIRVVLFDVIGTTVQEIYPDAINDCFEQAFADNQVSIDFSFLKFNRGKDKKEVIDSVIQSLNLPSEIGVRIYQDFKRNLENSFHNFAAKEGALELFSYLRHRDIKVCLGTGLPRTLFEGILRYLKWPVDSFDYIGIANEIGEGRPSPAMILDVMKPLASPIHNKY